MTTVLGVDRLGVLRPLLADLETAASRWLFVWMVSGSGDGNKSRCSMFLVGVTGSRLCRFDKKEAASFFESIGVYTPICV